MGKSDHVPKHEFKVNLKLTKIICRMEVILLHCFGTSVSFVTKFRIINPFQARFLFLTMWKVTKYGPEKNFIFGHFSRGAENVIKPKV